MASFALTLEGLIPMTRLHTSAHTDVTTRFTGRLAALTRTLRSGKAQPVSLTKATTEPLGHGTTPTPVHESFTQSWGELAQAAHERGEHEGRRYSLVCPACRDAGAAAKLITELFD